VIHGRKEKELTGGWRKIHDEELKKLQSSTKMIRLIKSRRMKWDWHVALMVR